MRGVGEPLDVGLLGTRPHGRRDGTVVPARRGRPFVGGEQVEYVASPIPFFTESEWIDDFTGQRPLDTTRLYRRYAYVKGMCWAYEREWRVWDPSGAGELFDERGIRPNEFPAVYFGCRADPGFVQQAEQLLAIRFPHVRCYQACKDPGRYGLLYGQPRIHRSISGERREATPRYTASRSSPPTGTPRISLQGPRASTARLANLPIRIYRIREDCCSWRELYGLLTIDKCQAAMRATQSRPAKWSSMSASGWEATPSGAFETAGEHPGCHDGQ